MTCSTQCAVGSPVGLGILRFILGGCTGMSLDNDTKGPAVKFPPPLVFLSFILLASLLQKLLPWTLPDSGVLNVLGALMVIASLVAIFMVKRSFDKVDTEIEPWKPTSAIVSTGLFAYSRNPIYLGFAVITVGVGLYVGSLWIVLSALPAALAVYRIAIKNEERYLEQKFGAEYLDYKAKVRRWI
ncbi:isoprenylcysteine carboxylmethyltransferase family protein [Leucothrix sargassi]|nr:isoprenylcysteine carboxylmethyltransferase family protein [Leucothrix sargassi]